LTIDDVCFYVLKLNDEEAAAKVTGKIEALPEANAIVVTDKNAVEAVEAAYNALTAEGKALISAANVTKLQEVRTALDAAILANQKTVTYTYYDSTTNSITADYGSKLDKPEDPVVAGRTFIGWSTDQYGNTLWDFDNNTVADSMTLYAIHTISVEEFLTAHDAENYSYIEAYVGFRTYPTGNSTSVLVNEDGSAVFVKYSFTDITLGNKIIMKGKYLLEYNLDKVTSCVIYRVINNSTELPAITATEVTLSEIETALATAQTRDYDNKLITVSGYWHVKDGYGYIVSNKGTPADAVRTNIAAATYADSTRLTLTGYVTYHYDADTVHTITISGSASNVEGIKFESNSASVAIGETTSVVLNLLGTPTGTASYASDTTSVATVDASTGVVTGVAAGEAVITATLGDYTASYIVTVTAGNTLTATYTVTSKTAVSSSGATPTGSAATYTQTYNTVSQMTNNNSVTLTITGYDGMTITGISLNMKSNKSGGAGYMTVTVGTTTIASIGSSNAGVAFSNAAWNGAYSQAYVDIELDVTSTIVGTGQAITITINATANSLFFAGATISYTAE
jgi:hypothetical protein